MAADMQSSPGKLVLLMGPSGVGKSVVLKELRGRMHDLHFPRSATTRARRPGEGSDLYRFVNDEQFDRLIADEKLLEWAQVHEGARYGTLIDEIVPLIEEGKIVVREVDVQGFENIRNHKLFSGEDAPYYLQSIFILPQSKEQLIDHITARAPIDDDELQRRIDSMEKELSFADFCNHRVMNAEGRLDRTIEEVEEIILRK